MRLLPILTAVLVCGFLYMLVFERETLRNLGSSPAEAAMAEPTAEPGADEVATEATEISDTPRVRVVAVNSTAQDIDNAVKVRGRTEAARQVDVRAETTGLVTSEPLRRGAIVSQDQLLCELDPGTRSASLAEARARLSEARARVPESEARVIEAQARLEEALINDNAASRLSEGGFASETRVASTKATVQSARAALQSAQSGLSSTQAGIESAAASVAAAEKEIERLEMHAPFGGLLESDTAELGALLQTGALCATIIQLDPIKLVGFIPEIDVDRVEVGARAGAQLVSGRQVQGEVTFLSRSADETTRTFRVEVEVQNDDLSIRDGQTVEILIAAEGTKAHKLPGSALTLDDGGNLGVRIADTDDLAQFVPVTLLRDTPDGVLVSGLPETARVITVGQEYVTDGVPVDVTLEEAQ
ncbi:efflux RND transporter periplasmic adaptor subunit [Shimia ponticola]|uniref:efflux RND transporter periplasmic adaptor subunit n=1 Tax=Shimia ponticola TaxID=2582893 RepID=UPI0011BD8DDC|nr:efflux RND transporter periplasmic adaptor subunit [Shimia ponticola]